MNTPVLPARLETERLLLRPYVFEDVEAIHRYAVDVEWGYFLPVPNPFKREDAVAFVARQVLLEPKEQVAWAIVHDDVPVGGINLRLHPEDRLGEMGWSIARWLWGRGLMTEAARAVLDAAFETCPELNRIRAMADARNVGSLRVMEKLGMQREGTLRQNRMARGKFVDEVWCGILRAEWQALER